MDTALELRIAFEKKATLQDEKIDELLQRSKLVQRLTGGYERNRLFAIFRILGLSEIPYTERLPYTQKMIGYINENVATPQGFSYLGTVGEIVPCYNAMMLEAYTRLGLQSSPEVQSAPQWIKRYQSFARNEKTAWTHDGICRHGGCLGSTPCYIGIGKTVRALISYAEFNLHMDAEVEELVGKGTNYMLQHGMYRRLRSGKPISAHITDLMFPQSYALSATDLAYIVGKGKLMGQEGAMPLLELLESKRIGAEGWKLDYIYSHQGYKAFGTKAKPLEWISALIPLWFGNVGFLTDRLIGILPTDVNLESEKMERLTRKHKG